MVNHKDHVMLNKWEFNKEVTNVFDEMLERSIPQYQVMRFSVHDMTSRYFVEGDSILDLGCSNGGGLFPVINEFKDRASKYVGVDVSAPMLEKARERFADNERVKIEECDLRHAFPVGNYGIIQAILCLCFIPLEHRQRVVSNCYDNLRDGGTFIVVDKLIGATAGIDNVLVDNYLKMKAENGYSYEEIVRKKYAIENVLVPVTAEWETQMLKNAGFRQVDCFWRWMNFAGFVAVK